MQLERRLRLASPAGEGIEVAWNPEFLREAHAVEDTLTPDRLVFGTHSKQALELLEEVYAMPLTEATPAVRCDIATAELIKVAANAFLATKISFINAMAEMCQAAGGDVILLADALGYDKRIGREFLNAGLGFGGGACPKTSRRLPFVPRNWASTPFVTSFGRWRRSTTVSAPSWRSWRSIRPAAMCMASGSRCWEPRSNPARTTHATRRPLPWADYLHARGADVRIYDPQARLPHRDGFTQVSTVEQAMRGARSCHLTEWPEFRQLDPRTARAGRIQIIIDGRLMGARAARRTWLNAGWMGCTVFGRALSRARRGSPTSGGRAPSSSRQPARSRLAIRPRFA